eukprot:jgi/Phyca11/560598/estExt2_Genewise1.C_PHYCAscaffold_50313
MMNRLHSLRAPAFLFRRGKVTSILQTLQRTRWRSSWPRISRQMRLLRFSNSLKRRKEISYPVCAWRTSTTCAHSSSSLSRMTRRF